MHVFAGIALVLCLQQPVPSPRPEPESAAKAPVQRLGENLFRVGNIRVDTAKREITVPGRLNDVQAMEFLANARGGMKAYETGITLDTDAINFNVALVLIGLDRRNSKPAQGHFDPRPVAGDPVGITVEYKGPSGIERGPVERLLFDKSTSAAVAPGEWVYTGSTFYPDGRYAAEVEGVLIGFAHTPSSVIESVKGVGLGRYGSIVLNPQILAGSAITVRVTALPKSAVPKGALPKSGGRVR